MSYTLPPKYQRYVNRIRELIAEGKDLYASLNGSRREDNVSELVGWWVKTENIIVSVFGNDRVQHQHYQKARTHIRRGDTGILLEVIGVLEGALNDLENGFLLNQEFLVASDVFDSVLEQAKHLLSAGYKDPAAILCRVVIEDSLKRLARTNGLDDTKKASAINQDLRQATIYNQPQWQQIDTWLTIGNKAAHGDFTAYNEDEVKRMIDGIESFLASYLSVI